LSCDGQRRADRDRELVVDPVAGRPGCGALPAAVRAACSQIAFRSCAVKRSPGVVRAGSRRQRSFGKVRSGASFPPPNHTGVPVRVVSPGRATAYPVIWPGLRVLNR
jgi:hypothetical protein